jgi:hypothetical protein
MGKFIEQYEIESSLIIELRETDVPEFAEELEEELRKVIEKYGFYVEGEIIIYKTVDSHDEN